MAALLLLAATPDAPDTAPGGIDQEVVLVGEDRAFLPVPGTFAPTEIALTAPDLRPVAPAYPGPFEPAAPPLLAPSPAEVLALVEATHA